MRLAKQKRSYVSFYRIIQDEGSEETSEDVSRDGHWDYAEILWNGIQAEAAREAFEKRNYKKSPFEKRKTPSVWLVAGSVPSAPDRPLKN